MEKAIEQEIKYLKDYLNTNNKKIEKLEKEGDKGLAFQERVGISRGLLIGINSIVCILERYEDELALQKDIKNQLIPSSGAENEVFKKTLKRTSSLKGRE